MPRRVLPPLASFAVKRGGPLDRLIAMTYRSLDYAVVVATRNRQDALTLSLESVAAQTRPPSQVIVADSSDDHQTTKQVVNAARLKGIDVLLLQVGRGLCHQRNRGLEHVTAPVAFFPDDDSVLFPDAAEAIMSVYENDQGASISAVAGFESASPPPAFPLQVSGYRPRLLDRYSSRILPTRTRLEGWLFPDPTRLLISPVVAKAASVARRFGVVPVEWMTGFRMTFRTDAIRKAGFDETLTNYCLYEDRDASFSAWREGAVVACPRSLFYHHRSPERRGDGRRMGVTQILNLAYLVAKHARTDRHPLRALKRYALYKCFLYALAQRDKFTRERLAGANAARRQIPHLLSQSPETLPATYQAALAQCLGSE